MAVGDTISQVRSLTNASSYIVQPPAGSEWIVHNIWHDRPLYATLAASISGLFFCGSIQMTPSAGADTFPAIHLTNSIFLVLNTNSAQVIAWDGIVSK